MQNLNPGNGFFFFFLLFGKLWVTNNRAIQYETKLPTTLLTITKTIQKYKVIPEMLLEQHHYQKKKKVLIDR